jgi:hypothetical protein
VKQLQVIKSHHPAEIPDHVVAVHRPREGPALQTTAECYRSACRLDDIPKRITSWAAINADADGPGEQGR